MIKIILLIALLLAPSPAFAKEGARIELTAEAIERGRALFTQHCSACHGLKYLRSNGAPAGLSPAMDPASAEAVFGVVPPDLSLITAARGRGTEGGEYVLRLLTSYYTAEDGQVRNRAFAEETKTDGAIAMPPPIPMDDPGLEEKAADISAFLLDIADPTAGERLEIGPWVVAYMALLTAVLYLLNRLTWKAVKKRLRG